jgi:TolB protein
MKKLHRFALAISLVPLVSFMTAGRSQGADAATCTKDDDCDDNNPCTKDKCDQDAGQCDFKPHDFGNHYGQPIACDDGNACTSGDVCHAGVCAGANVADGTACRDGNACTRSDSCQAGACTGADPIVCSARDQCHVAGTCDPASGACSDPAAPDGTACNDTDACSGPDTCQGGACGLNGEPVSTIAFTSGRDNPTGNPQLAAEVYLMDGDGTNPRRLTENADGDAFATLSPDGKGRIVFDSNRNRGSLEPLNTSDLFLMKHDGSDQTFLTRGSSATWSPDSQSIAFHRSASGTGLPIKPDPGAATTDSDIFVARVCDLVAHLPPTNITNTLTEIEDDADWSPDGQKIAFTRHPVTDNPNNSALAEIYVLNADGTGQPLALTHNAEEERAATWSPDGTRIAYMCRHLGSDFEICLMNADGTAQTQLTFNTVLDATPSWSPDGQKIAFHRLVAGEGLQLWVMNADGTGETKLTGAPGMNLFANWGEIKAGP